MPRLAIQDEHIALADFRTLELNAPADERWELVGGKVWRMMTGGTKAHNTVVQNIAGVLREGLRRAGRSCRPYTEIIRVVDEPADLLVFPDVVVDCGPFDPRASEAAEPVVVVEVLSPETRDKDVRSKGPRYRHVASIQVILFVEQDNPFVEVHRRTGEIFQIEEADGMDAIVKLPEIGVDLPVSSIYADVL